VVVAVVVQQKIRVDAHKEMSKRNKKIYKKLKK